MKRNRIVEIVLVGCFLMAGISITRAVDKPMNASVKQLDLDGNFLLFLKTDGIKKYVMNYLDTIEEAGANTHGMQGAMIKEGVTRIKTVLDWSGIFSFTSYAISRASTKNGLIRQISITQYDPKEIDKPIWHLVAGESRILDGINYISTNAVFVSDTSVNLTECWKAIEDGITTFAGPRGATRFQQKRAMFEMILGTNITAITDSSDHEIFLSLYYSKTKKISIPMGSTKYTIAEPSFLIGVKTKNSLLSSIIFKKLKEAGAPMTTIKQNQYIFHVLDLPPNPTITIQPTLLQTKQWFFIGSNPKVVQEALNTAAKKNGITSTALYKKLLKDAPEKVSSIEFISPDCLNEYLKLFQSILAQHPLTGSTSKKIFQTCKDLYMGGYSVKQKAEIYSKYYTSKNGAKLPEMIAVGYVGLFAAIGVPSFQKVRQKTERKMAINNARNVLAAMDQYALEHASKTGALIPSNLIISQYIRGGIDALKIGAISPNIPKELKVDDTISPSQFAVLLYPSLFPHKTRINNQKRGLTEKQTCANNQRIIQNAIDQWMLKNAKVEGAPVTWKDIEPYIKGGRKSITCPAGGTYIFNKANGEIKCSIHGNLLHQH